MWTRLVKYIFSLVFLGANLPALALTLPPPPPAALAVNATASGSFDLTDFSTVPNFTNGDVAIDIYRYDLGSALNGGYNFNFTTFANTNVTATLTYYILTDANDARYTTETTLTGIVTEGLWYDPDYYSPHPGSINRLSFDAVAGTNYYAMVWADTHPGQGSGALNLQVGLTPVPLPATLPLVVSGLAALGLIGRRRRSKI